MSGTIESRLANLEHKFLQDAERWSAVEADFQVVFAALSAVVIPVCAANPNLVPVILQNLRTLEKESLISNLHSAGIRRIRKEIDDLEAFAKSRGWTTTLSRPPR